MPYKNGQYHPFLDLVFCLDCTGSMDPYIKEAEQKIETISQKIFSSDLLARPDDLRVGIIAYRDYAPQDYREWTVNRFDFTSDMSEVKRNLSGLKAIGGGDGPEACASALYEAIGYMAWREQGARVIVLITDAPPHGYYPLLKSGDGFIKGDPHKEFSPKFLTPMWILKKLTEEKISVFVLACEPTLTSSYGPHGPAYYERLANQTAGSQIALKGEKTLADSIIAKALETVGLGKILGKLGGSEMSKVAHTNNRFARLFHTVAGIKPSDADVNSVYAVADDDDQLKDMLEELEDESVALKRAHSLLKGNQVHKFDTNVKHFWSPQAHINMLAYSTSTTPEELGRALVPDTGSYLINSNADQHCSITLGDITEKQVKRLAYMYCRQQGKA